RVQVREAETALVAEPTLVDLRVVAGEDPLDLALAGGGGDVAADGAEAAHAGHVLDLPGALLEAVLRRGQRADRAELDPLPRERRAVRLILERGDHGVRPAVTGNELPVLGDPLREPGAAVAEDAALSVEGDRGGDRDRLLHRPLLEGHSRVAWAEAE